MPWNRMPMVEKCCGCVTDLKTAAAIIAVLGIVTSPAVAWAVVRHSYVIRMSCVVTTSNVRPDVVDINLSNILSFGFGTNAGLGPSCLAPRNATNSTQVTFFRTSDSAAASKSKFVLTVRWVGWIVLTADFIFLGFSTYFLYKLFRPPERKAAKRFMMSGTLAILLSFVYGMLYVGACISVGGSFPLFEFVFSIFDVILWFMWLYFMIVIYSFIKECELLELAATSEVGTTYSYVTSIWTDMWNMIYDYLSAAIGYRYYLFLVIVFLLVFSVDLLFNGS